MGESGEASPFPFGAANTEEGLAAPPRGDTAPLADSGAAGSSSGADHSEAASEARLPEGDDGDDGTPGRGALERGLVLIP